MTDKMVERRIELMHKRHCGTLTDAERVELDELTDYFRELAEAYGPRLELVPVDKGSA